MRDGSRTARWWVLVAAIVAAHGFAPTAWLEAAAGSPQMRLERESIDLGTIAMGDPAEVRFELENVGDDVLKIYSAVPG